MDFPNHASWTLVETRPFIYITNAAGSQKEYPIGSSTFYKNEKETEQIYVINFLNQKDVLKIWRILERKIHKSAVLLPSGKWLEGIFKSEEEMPFNVTPLYDLLHVARYQQSKIIGIIIDIEVGHPPQNASTFVLNLNSGLIID